MSNLSMFLKQNKVKKENTKIAATKTLADEKGAPLLWELRPLTTKEDNQLRDDCTIEVQVTGKPNLFRSKFNGNKYLAMVASKSVIFPDLNSKELQDSYGVMSADQLITEMLDDPGEYNEFMTKMQAYHGFTDSFQDKVDEAKN